MLMALQRPQFIHFVAERNREMHPLKLFNAVHVFAAPRRLAANLICEKKKTTVKKKQEQTVNGEDTSGCSETSSRQQEVKGQRAGVTL